jgi:CheY-like chemotaxis protein
MKTSNLTFSSHGTVLTSMRFRILVADDDAEFRHLVTTVLEGDGYEVQQAANGRQLLDLLASWYDLGLLDASCHLIISDVRMPGYSGLDVLASLHGLGSRIPVIVITAFGDDDTRFLAAGLSAVRTARLGRGHQRSGAISSSEACASCASYRGVDSTIVGRE